MPALRGTAPTKSAYEAPLKAAAGSLVASIPLSSGKAQSSSSMTTPARAFMAGSISSSWRITGWPAPSISPDAIRNKSA